MSRAVDAAAQAQDAAARARLVRPLATRPNVAEPAAAEGARLVWEGFRWQGDAIVLRTLQTAVAEELALAAAEGCPTRPPGKRFAERLPAAWSEDGRLSTVKPGKHRSVHRLQLQGHLWFLKHDHSRRWGKAILHFCGRSAARREWNLLREAVRRGVPTIEPLAFGETLFPASQSILITRGLADAVPLDRFCEAHWPKYDPAEREIIRRRLTAALAELLFRLHAAGVEHTDLHAGNVLVRQTRLLPGAAEPPTDTAPDGGLLVPIDFMAVRLHAGPLPWDKTLRHLGMLGTSLRFVGSVADRRRVLAGLRRRLTRSTVTASTAELRPAAALFAAAETAVRRNRDRWRDHHERRCFRDGAFVRVVPEADGLSGWCLKGLEPAEERALCEDLRRWVAETAAESPLLDQARRTCEISLGGIVRTVELQLRTFPAGRWFSPWDREARDRWRMLLCLHLRRVPTTRPWLMVRLPIRAAATGRHGPLSREAVVEVCEVPADRLSPEAFRRRLERLPAAQRPVWRTRFATAAAEWLARRHDAGVRLTIPDELALVCGIAPGRVEVLLRNPAHASMTGEIPETECLTDLRHWGDAAERWSASPREVRTFLRHYLETRLRSPAELKPLRLAVARLGNAAGAA